MNKYKYKVRFGTKIMHKHELIIGKQQRFHQQKKLIANIQFEKYECFMSILHKNFIFELRIVKLHRKMILQQTPSSDTPTSGTHPPHFFSYLVCQSALVIIFIMIIVIIAIIIIVLIITIIIIIVISNINIIIIVVIIEIRIEILQGASL